MAKEIIEKKLSQLTTLLDVLKDWLGRSFEEFQKDTLVLRAAERNFQLIVDIACDMNEQLLLEKGMPLSETYRQSFIDIGKAGIISSVSAERLAAGARLRNILVHEYDFTEDDRKFYDSAKDLLPAYEEYAKAIYTFIQKPH